MFVFSLTNGNDDRTRYSFDEYYMPLFEIKDFNLLIDNKPFSNQPVKNKQKAYEKPMEMSRINDYTTQNLSDYLHHQRYCKFIAIDLSRQKNYEYSWQNLYYKKIKRRWWCRNHFLLLKSSM